MFSNLQKLFTTDVCCLLISVFGVNEKFIDMIKKVANSPRVFQFWSFALKIFFFEPEDLKNKIVNCLQKIGKIGILFIIDFIFRYLHFMMLCLRIVKEETQWSLDVFHQHGYSIDWLRIHQTSMKKEHVCRASIPRLLGVLQVGILRFRVLQRMAIQIEVEVCGYFPS